MVSHLIKVGNVWHYKRRVPTELRDVEPRPFVQKSTGKRDRTEAGLVAREFDADCEQRWAAMSGGPTPTDPAVAYEAAVDRAGALGIDYRDTQALADGPLEEILRRLELLEQRNLASSAPAVEAVLGGVAKPEIRISDLPVRYFAMNRDAIRGKSENQIRKWRNPRLKAINNLVALIGDKSIEDVTRGDALTFREWWQDRVIEDGMDPGSANKDIGYLNRMFGDISDKLRLRFESPFAGLRLKGERHNPRAPFDPEFVRKRILSPGALDGLNVEARLVVYVMVETGLRPSEIVTLTGDTIVLDSDVPHVQIRPTSRQLKTQSSQRDIPLVGISLLAARCAAEQFDGFPRYAANPDSLSGLVNAYLENASLRPTTGQTLYSLRHTFEDRLTAIEPPERIQVELMGHKFSRPKYGRGPSLAQKQDWLNKMMFPVPDPLPSTCLVP